MNLLDEINYQIWAEETFFGCIAGISAEQWTGTIPEIDKALNKIYAHKAEVLWFWFQFAKGLTPEDPPDFFSKSQLELKNSIIELLNEMKKLIGTKGNKELQLKLPWLEKTYPITSDELIFNGLNHLTYHRGQIAMIMKKLGIEVPETDYNPYMFEKLGF
ncbi:MAG: DinB family protein [Candidatus Odinarchaeota archaeon]